MGAQSSVPDRIQGTRSAFTRISQAYTVSEGEQNLKEKKRKGISKFATLRKKLARARRQSRSFDHAKAIREMLSTWPVDDIRILVQEYESAVALKELSLAASMARPSAHSLRYDLSRLYDCKFCTDVDLIFKNTCFPVHRAILSARSPFFKRLLSQHPEYGAQVHVKLKTPGVDACLFSALLRYLYTDELPKESLEHSELLGQLAGEFGVPNVLEHDMKHLLDSAELSDAVLVFSTDLDNVDSSVCHHGSSHCRCMTHSVYGHPKTSQFEFPCHRAIIASRSPFFRNLINRRAKSGEELTERTLRTPCKIILDESVIPRRYARVLLTALYQDTVDMGCVLRGSPSMCSLSEIQAMVSTGRCHMTVVDEAMELYQIGQFLDTQIISQGCEDIIIDKLTPDSLLSVLSWSAEPHGSQWVHRQAMAFLIEEFTQISSLSVLLDMSKDFLKCVISSDFLQCAEQDVLATIIKWGEHQLTKRIEEREPNLLCHTAHSVAKKGVKKRDLSDLELKELLSELLPLVRTDQILPPTNDVLTSAVKRGLIDPPLMCSNQDEVYLHRVGAWTGVTKRGLFLKPRLFLPYFEEAKSVLEELLSQGHDSGSKVRAIHVSAIPDTLYMIDERDVSLSLPYSGSPVSTVDIIAGTIPVPDKATFVKMLEREQELQQSKPAQQATSLAYIDKRTMSKNVSLQIQLRVVREFGLPDSAVEVLQNRQYYYTNNSHSCRHHHHRCQQAQHLQQHYQIRSRSSASNIPQSLSYDNFEWEHCVENSLSEMMPDIALASRTLSQIHLYDESLEPDIGDRSTERHATLERHGTLYI
ncbi:BTB/POZ domain-containing protein 7 [Biomphalaria glabrata]|uniref:BTB/POZ domain-containing protein 7-like n=1 Tax=Biomphalaria glabrata TaxID=6526 RepID=A0A9W2ZV24_BIOGL|nr:BTB/POZ domain-containing protein 7-like [Biomphalaria glabrata]KAI8740766.1 BTB/POZ domain-containing protein 7-like [Biomphalaria glabrata]